MPMSSLKDLFQDELRDLYHAEKQILRALPKMINAASDQDLQSAFQEHLDQTQEHVARLEQIFKKQKMAARGKVCKGMQGIIEEGQELLKEDAEQAVLDAALIAAAQKVEHYEIASYGTIRTYAQEMGKPELAQLLQQTLDEEYAANDKLTQLAERRINLKAE